MDPRLTVLSLGGGQDSTDLLYRYADDQLFRARFAPRDFLVLMIDTGDEHPHTYRHIGYVREFCAEQRIKFHFVQPQDGCHSEAWHDLRSFYRRTRTCGSKRFPKSCTDNLKIRPFYTFLNRWVARTYGFCPLPYGRYRGRAALVTFAGYYGKIRVLIGIAKGEEKRRAAAGPEWMERAVERRYPLVELGVDRQGCQESIRASGRPIPYPSNCMLCPWMSKIELLWLAEHYPEDFAAWVEIEREKLKANSHMATRNCTVWGEQPLIQVLADARQEYGHLSPAELDRHKFSHGHCVQSRY
jgi:3'-phosphoadenosine 5'-phosphosulfate sulfotransferase (PAPS reductase)/FAD synthetase